MLASAHDSMFLHTSKTKPWAFNVIITQLLKHLFHYGIYDYKVK